MIRLSSQDCDHTLSLIPTHLLHQFDTSHQITSTTGSEEESIMLDEVTRHGYCFFICGSDNIVGQTRTQTPNVGSDYRNASSITGRASSMLFVSRLIPLFRSRYVSKVQREGIHKNIHSFDDCIDLMPSFRSFSFAPIIHDPVFDL